jgi:hypothetical protein
MIDNFSYCALKIEDITLAEEWVKRFSAQAMVFMGNSKSHCLGRISTLGLPGILVTPTAVARIYLFVEVWACDVKLVDAGSDNGPWILTKSA